MPATDRRGEKNGWLFGWAGGFLWVAILAVVRFVQGKTVAGLLGLLLVAVAAAAIVRLAPWRHPARPYWKLELPIYLLFLLSIGWYVVWQRPDPSGFTAWSSLLLLPLLLPLYLTGRRRWIDGAGEPVRPRTP